MITDVTFFWLIHLFIGIIVPILAYSGCCRPKSLEGVNVGTSEKAA